MLPIRTLIPGAPRWAWAAALLLSAGCGSSGKLAPVSGTITLDGKPLGNALVAFQPIAESGKPNAGVGSSGLTDASGKYTLKTMDTDHRGATTGKHRVEIRMKVEVEGDKPKPQAIVLPPKYNLQSQLQFDVQAAGTDAANFDLKSR